jgi:cell division protein FtsI (penicillin-binding protein 3)
MEVRTGEIKAIANLERNSSGGYSERYNYALGESTEPGSTFKLMSLMVAMEDGYIRLEDSIDTGNGEIFFFIDKGYQNRGIWQNICSGSV